MYGARTAEDMLYTREVTDWRGRFDLDVQTTVDRSTSGWRGNVGVVTTLIPHAPCDPARTVAYVCGNPAMVDASCVVLAAAGLASAAVSVERF